MDDEELDRLTQALLEEEDDELLELPFGFFEKKETLKEAKKAVRQAAIKEVPLPKRAHPTSKLEQTVRGAVKTELRKTTLQPGPTPSKGRMVPGLARRPGGPAPAPTTREPPVRILQPNGPKGPSRSSVMPMDPTVEQRMTSAERAAVMRERLGIVQEQRRKEDRKRAREVAEREQELLTKKQSIAPPPFNPAVAFRSRATSKFGESARAPGAPGGPDRLQQQDVDRQNEALWELNKLKVSILGMFPLPYLDERGIADMDRYDILEFVREGMATVNQRQAIDYALRRIRNAQVRGDLTQYYEWLLDLARAHRHWTEIQLDLLHELKRQRLKCEAVERISGNFARYLRDLKRLSEKPDHNAILGEYLQLPLGISPRQLAVPMDKFEALWSHLIGRRSLLFEELRARDHNCTSAELLSVLENLEKAAITLIALLTDETRKADWSNRLVRIQDEIARLQELGKPEEIDYNDLLFEWLQ